MSIPQQRRGVKRKTEVPRLLLVLWMMCSVMKRRMEMSLPNSFPIVMQVKVEGMSHVFVALCVAMNMIIAAVAEIAIERWMEKHIERVRDRQVRVLEGWGRNDDEEEEVRLRLIHISSEKFVSCL